MSREPARRSWIPCSSLLLHSSSNLTSCTSAACMNVICNCFTAPGRCYFLKSNRTSSDHPPVETSLRPAAAKVLLIRAHTDVYILVIEQRAILM